MGGDWKKVVQLRFKGGHYEDRALDQRALTEVLHFQQVLRDTAKELWRQEHPGSGRLPNRFEDRINLWLRRIGKGSTCFDLEVYLKEPEQGEFWDREPTEARGAVQLASEVFRAVGASRPLPERLPKGMVAEYAKIGQGLGVGESLEFGLPRKQRVMVTSQHRERLLVFAETHYEDTVERIGEVIEADVKLRRFDLCIDQNTRIPVAFSEDQEEQVTRSLAEHRSVQLKVVGRGIHSPEGNLVSIKEVTGLTILHAGDNLFDANARPIEEIIAEIASQIPEEEWREVPEDLSINLDHYLYGAPKK